VLISNAGVRAAAIIVVFLEIAFAGKVFAGTDLVKALTSDPSPRVRAQAALGLESKGKDPKAVSALIAALGDSSRLVRGSAAKALGTIGAPEAFAPLCRAALDPNAFVAKWAKKSAIRVASSAPVVTFNVRGLKAKRGWRPDTLTKAYQEGVLEELLSRDRFDVASSMDFRDDVEKGEPGPQVMLVLEGEVVGTTGNRKKAEARVTFRAVAVPGVVIWKGKAKAKGKGGEPPPPDPYADEYTIVEEPPDAREMAVTAAGKAVAASFAKALSR